MESIVPLGLIVGAAFLQGALGTGGGVLFFPILSHFYSHSFEETVLNTLGLVALVSWIAILQYWGKIPWRLVPPILIPAIAMAVFTELYIVHNLPEIWMGLYTHILLRDLQAFFIAYSGWILLFSFQSSSQSTQNIPIFSPGLIACSLIVGCLTALIGSGGGIVLLPALILIGNIEPAIATLISFAVIGLISSAVVASSPIVLTLTPPIVFACGLGMAIGLFVSASIAKEKITPWLGGLLVCLSGFLLFHDLRFFAQIFHWVSDRMT